MEFARLLTALSILLLVGCTTLRGAPPTPFKADKIWTDQTVKNMLDNLSGDTTNSFPVKSGCEDTRDFYARQLIAYIDANYLNYRQSFVFDRQHADAVSSGLQLMMTVAGTLTESKGVKDNYLAGIALMTGGEAIYDKSYLFDKSAPALVTQMDATRKERLVVLLGKLDFRCDQYPGQIALSDILDYYYVGTIVGAIEGAQKDAKKKDEEATRSLQDLNTERLKRGAR